MDRKKDKKSAKECNKAQSTGITYAEHINKWQHWVVRTIFGQEEVEIEREE